MAHKKKSTKPHKKGSKKKKAGLKGTAALKAAKKGTMESFAKPAGIFGGLILGSVASKLMDKIPFLAPDPADDGKFHIKKLIKPLVLAGIGTGIAIATHKKTGAAMQVINGVGLGLAGAGLISGIKAGTGKDLLALGEPGANQQALEANYNKVQLNDMAKMIEEGKFKANLDHADEGTDGVGRTEWGTHMNAEESGMVM